jgi:hypothetical protein
MYSLSPYFPLLVVLVGASVACSDPPDQTPCPETSDGGGTDETGGDACEPVDDPEMVAEACADPEFGVEPEFPPTQFSCQGVGGGAVVYNSVVVLGQGGPGALELDPPEIVFPDADPSVQACCIAPPADEVDITTACESDCARAACNRVLQELRTGIELEDPSDGACAGINACIERLRDSIIAWEASLVAQYDKCLSVARINDDPGLPYNDFLTPFVDERKVVLDNADCNPDHLGCLYAGEVRLYCSVDGFERVEDSLCETAGNPRDPMSRANLMSVAPGPSIVSVTTPHGSTIDAAVNSLGGTVRVTCEDDHCTHRILDFKFALAAPTTIGPFRFSEVTAEFSGVPRGSQDSNNSIVFTHDSTTLWITGMLTIGSGKLSVKYPTQFSIRADSNMQALDTGLDFSIEGFHADFHGHQVHLATTPAPYAPL